MLLSICLPTHNGRVDTLREAIESILPQVVDRREGAVQIVVSDNGSEDGTAAMLADYQARYPHIFVTHRFETNQGGHVNFLKVVDMASGEYCWLFGSDDQLEAGAVDTMLDALRRHGGCTGVTCLWRSFGRSMRSEHEAWCDKVKPKGVEERSYADGVEAARELGLLLQFMSANAFLRSEWQKIVQEQGRDGVFRFRHFMFAGILCEAMVRRGRWIYIADKLVRHRDQNESLVDELGTGRHRYLIETAEDIALCWSAALGGKSAAYRHLMRQYFRLRYSGRNIAAWKELPSHTPKADAELLRMMVRYHSSLPEFWFLALPSLLVPERLHKIRVATAMYLAPRSRLRAALGRAGVDNSWTRKYDELVATRHLAGD